MFDLDNISHNCCLWPKGVSWSWPKVISLRSRLHCIHTLKWCLGLNSSLSCSILIIFYTIVFPNPRVRHDLDRMSYLKGQGHSTLIANICVRSITDYCHVWCSWYLTHLYCDLHSGSYRIAGYVCGYKFLRFGHRIDRINFCGFYFCGGRSKRNNFCGSNVGLIKGSFYSIKSSVVCHLYMTLNMPWPN